MHAYGLFMLHFLLIFRIILWVVYESRDVEGGDACFDEKLEMLAWKTAVTLDAVIAKSCSYIIILHVLIFCKIRLITLYNDAVLYTIYYIQPTRPVNGIQARYLFKVVSLSLSLCNGYVIVVIFF